MKHLDKEIEQYFLNEDEKYGGIEANNEQEALDYFQIEDVFEIRSKDLEDLNQKIEEDYHNTYYNTKTKKYGVRQIKMNNKEWHELNKMK